MNIKALLQKAKPVRVLIIVLSILLFINAGSLMMALIDYGSPYRASEISLLYRLESYNYDTVREQLGYYSAEEIAASETLIECYHVAFYFENTILYYAYLDTDPTRAAAYQAAREENAAGMGVFSNHQTYIDNLFASYTPNT